MELITHIIHNIIIAIDITMMITSYNGFYNPPLKYLIRFQVPIIIQHTYLHSCIAMYIII